ncbi:hypothetical protein QO010_004672 [Caulobacter ginsengisoli]|uniref:Uncharacterized protein n=1 Tax=Caulobacter ginsengisoli TaxID=400775 RepID=A0ABU0IZU0_9CAUL|nr:hypothetical protein [Caulobacter ginsengisoli]MDQ0466875.1 hypothetical protein [Caulobacter ginsengisoli]
MANPAAESEFAKLPAWKGWLLLVVCVVGLAALAVALAPQSWFPAWLDGDRRLSLIGLTIAPSVLIVLWTRRDGRWSSVRPFERVLTTVALALWGAVMLDMILKIWGGDLIPAGYEDVVQGAAFVGMLILMVTRGVLRGLDDAKPRRHDIAMGE